MFALRFDMRLRDGDASAPALYRAAIEMAEWGERNGAAIAMVSEHHASSDGYLPAPLVLDPGNGACVDLSLDPLNCGSLGNQCGSREYCVSGNCVCRSPLTLVAGNCIDTTTSPTNCGGAGIMCGGGTQFCQAGTCVATCTTPDQCGMSCTDTNTDIRNCGGCGNTCAVDEVCTNGNCRPFYAAAGCTMCPCTTACVGDFSRCCTYPGSTNPICVDSGRCP